MKRCSVSTEAGGDHTLFSLQRLVSHCVKKLNFAAESNHPENRICHRESEVLQRGKVNSRGGGKAASQRGRKSLHISDPSQELSITTLN